MRLNRYLARAGVDHDQPAAGRELLVEERPEDVRLVAVRLGMLLPEPERTSRVELGEPREDE